MKIEEIKIKNFKSFKDAEMKKIPNFCVVIGANGSGKSTIFSIFEFLKEALKSDVTAALMKLGGHLGFDEVRTRNSTGPISIEIKFREDKKTPLITYELKINKEIKSNQVYIEKEVLKYKIGKPGKQCCFIDFRNGSGTAVTNETELMENGKVSDLKRETQKLKSPDILAIKGLAQFEKFPAVVALGNLIENWHISDFHVNKARNEQEISYAEHLSREGENLSLVIQYLYKNHKDIFEKIIETLKSRIPGISNIEVKTTDEGRVLLKFQDGAFKEKFLARHVSDGTIKMLAYIVLLYDPNPHQLLCVEEPENQLYPNLLWELTEEFRAYSKRGGQVFVSTHSPDFLNGTELNEVFWLEKKNGFSKIKRAADDKQIKAYMDSGDQMGYLWKQGFFGDVDY